MRLFGFLMLLVRAEAVPVEMNGVYYLSNYSAGTQYEYGVGHRVSVFLCLIPFASSVKKSCSNIFFTINCLKGEYIDVYSHNISTHYSEVYWTMQPSIPLPADFVKRFDGKIVALTG